MLTFSSGTAQYLIQNTNSSYSPCFDQVVEGDWYTLDLGELTNPSFVEGDTIEQLLIDAPTGETLAWYIHQHGEIEGLTKTIAGGLEYPGRSLSITIESNLLRGLFKAMDGSANRLEGCIDGYTDIQPPTSAPSLCIEPEISESFVANCGDIDPCQATVRVLYLFTPGAIVSLNVGISNYISLANVVLRKTRQINESLFESGVYNKRIASNLVETPYTPPGGLPTLPAYQGDYLAMMAQMNQDPIVQGYRAQYNADLVYLVTGDDETGGCLGCPTGVANSIGATPNESYAVSRLNVWYWLNDNTHELGHLFGCSHENINVCSRGYAFGINPFNQKRLQTTMVRSAGDLNNNQFVRLYSNPRISVLDQATGVFSQRFCAAQVSELLCNVSQIDENQ